VTLYADSSALVKLYVVEPETERVQRLVSGASTVVTSTVAFVEIRAALAHARRERRLTPLDVRQAKQRLEEDWHSFVTAVPDSALLTAAANLAERHGLRALDSIHLATFQQVLERTDDEIEFSSFDDRLTIAAKRLRSDGARATARSRVTPEGGRRA
jgi:predicted nucleic acid-binding protein